MSARQGAPVAGQRAGRTVHGMRARSRTFKATVAAVLVAVIAGGVLAVTLAGPDTVPKARVAQSAPTYKVMAPADGSLLVGTVQVPQLAGECSGDSCRYTAQSAHTELPVVTIDTTTRKVPLKATQSHSFSVSAFNTAKPSAMVSLGYAGGLLLVDSAPVGSYQVSLSGDRGGIWQFTLKVTKPGKK